MPRTLSELTPGRRVLLAAIICAAAAWAAGPAGRLPLAMALIGLAPGYLLERLLPGSHDEAKPLCPHPLVRLALWLAFSLSLVALLYQWLWPLGLALAAPALFALAALAGIAAGALAWQELGPVEERPRTKDEGQPTTDVPFVDAYGISGAGAKRYRHPTPDTRHPPFFWLLLALVCGLTLWTRFEQIKSLALPSWVDSVHHALLVRIVAETGRAPSSLEPYLPVANLPYHWGYHVFTGSLLRLSGLSLAETMLWSGQILNALHAPLAGAMALILWRQPRAAIGAAMVAGLISLMPAYYVSWGRYTQLTGLLLLPGLAFAWARGLESGRRPYWAAASLILAGLSLIHVRVLAFALGLLAAQTVVWAAGASWPTLRARAIAWAGVGLGAAALAAPWLLMLLRRALLPAVARPGSLVLADGYEALNLAILWVGYNQWLAALAFLAILWGLWARRPRAAILPLWVGLLLVMANMRLLGYVLPAVGAALLLRALLARRLPGALLGAGLIVLGVPLFSAPSTWLINNDAVVISLFLPLSVAVGGGAAGLYEAARRSGPPPYRRAAGPVAVALVVALGLWGSWQLRSVVNETTVLATPADRAAIEWAAANTPPDARFLINTTPWLGIANRATDGGWWLLPLAGRWTSTPPALFTYGSPDYVQATIERTKAVAAYQPGGEQAILELMRRDGIGYIYFGAKPGTLQPQAFAAIDGVATVYSRDGVTILAVESQT
jgi:hypothetical protein